MQALGLAAVLGGCSHRDGADEQGVLVDGPRTLDQIRESGFLNIGIASDNAPLSFLSWKGVYDGIDQYFGLHLANTLRVAPRYVAIDPYQRYDALLDGIVDVSLAQMSPEDARADEVTFSAPLYALKLGILSPKDAVVDTPELLAEGELVVCEGSFAHQYATDAFPDVTLRTYDTLSESYAALVEGHGIALVADEISIAAWMKKNPGFVLGIRDLGDRRHIAPAFVGGQEDLLPLVDEAVSTFISYGYRSRSYTSDAKPLVGDAYLSIFDGITA